MNHVKLIAAGAFGAAAIFTGSAFAAPVVTQDNSANDLADFLIGSGITRVGDATLTTADDAQAGTFTGGTADVGLDTGVILSSGNVNTVGGANTLDTYSTDYSTDYDGAGDAQLTAIAGQDTYDASILEFDFQFGDGSTGGDLFFSFVFGSEEYLEYVDEYNDVFGFFVDGTNVATIGGDPISINNINDVDNSALYRNNPAGSGNVDLKIDGLTTAIVISVLDLAAGTHHMKFAIADARDHVLDSVVFIGGGSFSDEPPPVGDVPLPAAFPLMLAGLAGLRFSSRRKKKA